MSETSLDLAQAGKLAQLHQQLREEVGRVIVGQEGVLDLVLTALFARGHVLLVGVPGLAKTRMVSTLAQVLDLDFRRIQFTPDLMPSDVTGTDILQEDPLTHERRFHFVRGPVFAQIVLADEINRTPPRTQSALLQAMQEHHVTVSGQPMPLPEPFMVLATQNPIEQEGTYPLPEAQLDRFLFQINLTYPTAADEAQLVRRTTEGTDPALKKILTAQAIPAFQALVRRVPLGDDVLARAVDLVRRSRPQDQASEFVRRHVQWGAGPRAAQALALGAKVRCLLEGRTAVAWEDVAALAPAVLRHRLVLSFRAGADGVSTDTVVDHLLKG